MNPDTDTPRTDACPHYSIVQLEQGDKITTQCTRCGKKLKVVKKPSCSCYGGFDCEICNPDYYEEMTTTTDTPRTDDFVAENSLLAFVEDKYELTLAFARQLERELNELWSRFDKQMEAEAEVERLKKWKDNLVSNLMALEIYEHKHSENPAVALASYGQWNFKHGEWEAQAEVERLREQLESTKLLAVKFWNVLEEHGFELEINQ